MKRFFTLSIVVFVVALAISSCKSHERCPAYSKVEKTNKVAI